MIGVNTEIIEHWVAIEERSNRNIWFVIINDFHHIYFRLYVQRQKKLIIEGDGGIGY